VTAAWNPSDKSTGVTLSTTSVTNDKATVSGVNTAPYEGVRGALSKSSGKFYLEVVPNFSGAGVPVVALCDGSFTLTAVPGQSGNCMGWWSSSGPGAGNRVIAHGVFTVASQPASDWAPGDVTQVAVDLDAGKAWLGRNGTFNGNPAAGTSPTLTFTANTTLFPLWSFDGGSAASGTGVIRCGSVQQAFSPPTGFSAWDVSTTVLSVTAGSFTETGIAVTMRVAEPVAVGTFAETGFAAVLRATEIVTAGAFAETGIAAFFQVAEPAARGQFTLTGPAMQIAGLVSFGSFAFTGEPVAFQPRLSATFGAFALAGQLVFFDPSEPVTTGLFTLTGEAAYLSYDLLGGGSSISGGTFSRQRWRDMLDAIVREREAEQQRLRDEKLRRRAERRQCELAAAELRRDARLAAAVEAERLAAELAASHATAAQAGAETMRTATAHVEALARAAHAAADAATQVRAHDRNDDRNDEEEALMLLLAA
jgi:hypothetical protein